MYSSQIHSHPDPKAAEYLAGWQRARAELDNFRKKVSRDQVAHNQQQLRVIIEPLLQLNDNFRAMIDHLPEDLADHPWVQGVTHVARQLSALLEQYNVQVIEAKNGDLFDPHQHEAIEQVAGNDVRSGHIVSTVQVGYQLSGAVIRPAKVKVAA